MVLSFLFRYSTTALVYKIRSLRHIIFLQHMSEYEALPGFLDRDLDAGSSFSSGGLMLGGYDRRQAGRRAGNSVTNSFFYPAKFKILLGLR